MMRLVVCTKRDARRARSVVEMLDEAFWREPIITAATLFGRSASAGS